MGRLPLAQHLADGLDELKREVEVGFGVHCLRAKGGEAAYRILC
jgi:hypothetical protein